MVQTEIPEQNVRIQLRGLPEKLDFNVDVSLWYVLSFKWFTRVAGRCVFGGAPCGKFLFIKTCRWVGCLPEKSRKFLELSILQDFDSQSSRSNDSQIERSSLISKLADPSGKTAESPDSCGSLRSISDMSWSLRQIDMEPRAKICPAVWIMCLIYVRRPGCMCSRFWLDRV